jgi:hypothetical protein
MKTTQRLLLAYCSVLSTICVFVFLTGAKSSRPQTFDEIQTHGINIVEPDGTLRMVISNKARLPGVIVRESSLKSIVRKRHDLLQR